MTRADVEDGVTALGLGALLGLFALGAVAVVGVLVTWAVVVLIPELAMWAAS